MGVDGCGRMWTGVGGLGGLEGGVDECGNPQAPARLPHVPLSATSPLLSVLTKVPVARCVVCVEDKQGGRFDVFVKIDNFFFSQKRGDWCTCIIL